MEAEIELEVVNNTVYVPNSRMHVYYMMHHILMLSTSSVGLLSNILIIYTIASCKILRTKMNIVVMNIAINDGIFLLMLPLGSSFNFGRPWFCISEGGFTGVCSCMILIWTLLMNPIMLKESITAKKILFWLYLPMGIILVFRIILCIMRVDTRYSGMLLAALYGLLVLTMLIFEIITLLKKKFSVVDEDYTFRFNICRIYTYNYLLVPLIFIAVYVDVVFLQFLSDFVFLSLFLTSFYILLYITFTNKNFKMCLLSIFRRDKYNVDASLNSGIIIATEQEEC